MKFSYLTSLGFATLLFGCSIANAQTAPNGPSDQSATPQRDSPGYSRADGDDLNTTSKSPRDTVSSTPRSIGQDKSTGNDMVSTNGATKKSGTKQAISNQSRPVQKHSPGYRPEGNDLDTPSQSARDTVSSAPRSIGQDKSTGNDMVSTNGTAKTDVMKRANAGHPDFDTLDIQKKGVLTSADVRSNRWLRGQFLRCDTDHDGTLSRNEYENCH